MEKNLNDFNLNAFSSDNTINNCKPTNHNESQDKATNRTLHHSESNSKVDDDEVRELVAAVTAEGRDITNGYENWLRLGFALASHFGEGGRQLFHELSRMNSQYNKKECDRKFTSCLKSEGNGITIKTFFQLVKDAGINIGEIKKRKIKSLQNSATCATCAIAPNTENTVKTPIFSYFGANGAMAQVAQVAQTQKKDCSGYTFSDKLKIEDLPQFLLPILEVHKSITDRDKMMLGVLNVVSGLMGGANGSYEAKSGIYGLYDGRRIYAPLYNIAFGVAGSSKGEMAFCKLVAKPVKNEMRRTYEAQKAEYEKELAEYEALQKGKKKTETGNPPKEPLYKDPFVPGNSSSAAVYRAIDANGGWGMMFETEADTVSNMISSDYGNYSDMMRKAHHHETISMNRVSEKLHIDIEEPRLSVFLTCTPGQLQALFPSFETGLGSRFLFYSMPSNSVNFHNVFAMTNTPLEDTYRKMGDSFMPLYHELQARVNHPIQFVMSNSQQHEFVDTYQQLLKEQFSMLGNGISAFIFRLALQCFRYAMILTTLRRLSEWTAISVEQKEEWIFRETENALVCDERDFHTAMTIVGCLVNHTARVYAILAKDNENPFAQCGINLKRDELEIFNNLPDTEFRTVTFTDTAQKFGFSKRSATRLLSQFCNVYCILVPLRRGVYRKASISINEIE